MSRDSAHWSHDLLRAARYFAENVSLGNVQPSFRQDAVQLVQLPNEFALEGSHEPNSTLVELLGSHPPLPP
jgi:hypothetical protein